MKTAHNQSRTVRLEPGCDGDIVAIPLSEDGDSTYYVFQAVTYKGLARRLAEQKAKVTMVIGEGNMETLVAAGHRIAVMRGT